MINLLENILKIKQQVNKIAIKLTKISSGNI